jgi:hypothetical protein
MSEFFYINPSEADFVAVVKALKNESIPFHISSLTPGGHLMFIMESYPFTLSELCYLLESGELHHEGIRKLRACLEDAENQKPRQISGMSP